MKRNKFFSVFLFFFTFCSVVANDQEDLFKKNVYHDLENLFMPSVVISEQDLDKNKIIKDVKKKKNKRFNLKIPKVSEYESFKIIFELLQNSKKSKIKKSITNVNIGQDLCLFCGDQLNIDNNLLQHISRTETRNGKVQLAKMLFSPTNNVEKLKKRQDVIRRIVEDEELFKSLDENLKEIKKGEVSLLSLWKELDKASEKLLDVLFYPQLLKVFKESSLYIQTTSGLETGLLGFSAGLTPIVFFIYPILLKNANRLLSGDSLLDFEFDRATLVTALIAGGLGFLGSKQIYSQLSLKAKTSNKIQQKMIGVAKYVNGMKNISEKVSSTVAFQDLFSKTRQNYLEHKENNKRIMNLLSKGTFKGEPSFFSNTGNIFKAYSLVKKQKQDFIKSMKALGQIDAYLSFAKLYKENQNNKNARYCFVEYKTSEFPCINLSKFWNPFLDPNKVVTNDLELGNDNRNMILTGPNAAGKSTVLKSTTIALLMAQTFGIAPAEKLVFTPFSKIYTYLNITDTTGQESLFQAEMHRAQDLVKTLKSLKPSEFNFVIMDEIFTGTNPKEGKAAAYGISRCMSEFENSICILATHFKKLTSLEKDTYGSFKNYKVTAIKDENGFFSYPYKLLDGVSDQNIALDLLQNEGFDSNILDYAYNSMLN